MHLIILSICEQCNLSAWQRHGKDSKQKTAGRDPFLWICNYGHICTEPTSLQFPVPPLLETSYLGLPLLFVWHMESPQCLWHTLKLYFLQLANGGLPVPTSGCCSKLHNPFSKAQAGMPLHWMKSSQLFGHACNLRCLQIDNHVMVVLQVLQRGNRRVKRSAIFGKLYAKSFMSGWSQL